MLINRPGDQLRHSQLVCRRQEGHAESQGNEPRQLCDEGPLLVIGEGEMLEQSQGRERKTRRGVRTAGALCPPCPLAKRAPLTALNGARDATRREDEDNMAKGKVWRAGGVVWAGRRFFEVGICSGLGTRTGPSGFICASRGAPNAGDLPWD